ncbi:MAG TPA: hypothetical protein VFY29_15205, partial [Terriglobia bacterium]|nr:hypothetical protein [Terriglobia bacterium]
MRAQFALPVLILAGALSTARAETVLRVIPPAGATFAPGQRFDIRVEADDLKSAPGALTFTIDGRDSLKEVFGPESFKTFTIQIPVPAPAPAAGRGVTATGRGA